MKPAWNKGLTKETDNRVMKQSQTVKGRVKSLEHCRKISEAKKNVPNPKHSKWCKEHQVGINNPFYGKHHNDNTKNIISNTNKGNTNRRGKTQYQTVGENNPAKRPDVRLKISQRVKETHWDSSLENNPNWKGGSSFLPYKPYRHKRKLLEKKDIWGCILCGTYDDLTIYHIDYDKLNDNDDNLCLLCRKHNSFVNNKREFYRTVLTNYVNMIRNKEYKIYNADLLNIGN